MLIKNKKRENMHIDRCGNNSGQKCRAKGSRKGSKIQELCIEIYMKCMIIPVITGANGIVTKGIKKAL